MINFRHLREELQERKDPKSKTLHAFDMDEVLFHHDHSKLKVHVKDQHGKRVQSLTNTEYNDHKLKHGHSYDYGDFKSHKVFQRSAHPIHKMINKLRAIHRNNKNVRIVTARSDMDDKHGFMKTLRNHGIDPHQIHVHRAGNVGAPSPAEAKHRVIGDLIRKHGYKKVHLYDDSHANLHHFLKLKDDHPDVEFHAHHVSHDPETGKVKITTTKA
jgi:hypothetical protein